MNFIQPQHPKSSLKPDPFAIRRVLARGWRGQKKINGSRAQIHISPKAEFFCYTRQGTPHTVKFPDELREALYPAFKIASGWTVIDAEWERYKNRLHLFDLLRVGGASTQRETYRSRHEMLRVLSEFISHENIVFLPIIDNRQECLDILGGNDEEVEGLVFRSMDIKGWPDTAIIRCRKEGL